MNISSILVAAVVACVLTVILNQHKPEFSLFVRLAAILLITAAVLSSFNDFFQFAFSFNNDLKINKDYIILLVKALVIAIGCRIVSDLCSDTGNKAIATCIELTGQIAIMLLALPMLSSLANFAKELIK